MVSSRNHLQHNFRLQKDLKVILSASALHDANRVPTPHFQPRALAEDACATRMCTHNHTHVPRGTLSHHVQLVRNQTTRPVLNHPCLPLEGPPPAPRHGKRTRSEAYPRRRFTKASGIQVQAHTHAFPSEVHPRNVGPQPPGPGTSLGLMGTGL